MDTQPQSETPAIQPLTQTNTHTPSPIQGSKNKLFIILGFVVIAVSVGAGILIGNSRSLESQPTRYSGETPTDQVTAINNTPVPTSAPTNAVTSVDTTWNLYTNSTLGFTLKIPKTAYTFGGTCVSGKLDAGLVPVKTFDDSNGTYVTYEYFYEYPVNNACQKTITDLNIIEERANQWKSGNGNTLIVPGNWHIITTIVKNDVELEKFIQTQYGQGCKIGTKTPNKTGSYDVKIEGDGLDLEKTKCPINFVYALKYSPELKKAAVWSVGQSVVFASKDYTQTYDTDIIESFAFTH